MKFWKIALSLFCSLFLFLGLYSSVLAEESSSKAYTVTYEVVESGQTTVTYQIALTNLSTQTFTTGYGITLYSTQISDVRAADRLGLIQPEVTKDDEKTEIKFNFNDVVVGKGRVLNFTFSFKTPEIANKSGRIWEINIPAKDEESSVTRYDVILKVPPSFGKPAYLSPQPIQGLLWSKEQVKGGITAAFGQYQISNFILNYHLKNPQTRPVYTEITLPSDTAYQRIKFNVIKPEPISLRVDEDGNWLARYNLDPKEKLNIQVSGLVKLSYIPDPTYQTKHADLKRYLEKQEYWESDDEQIKKLARELKIPRAIYDYVVSTLEYSYDKALKGDKRQGAKKAIEKSDWAVCMEFTDLFIALARAAGIPAREVDGFAYTTNSKLRPLSLENDVLHTWPEYWDEEKKIWIMVDPTWADTTGGINYFDKLDFNHFALAIKGLSSETPFPAGTYKIDGSEGKDVTVEPSNQEWTEEKTDLDVNFNLPKTILSGITLGGSVSVTNKGSTAIYNKQLEIVSSDLPIENQTKVIKSLAPMETIDIPFRFPGSGLFNGIENTVMLKIDGQQFEKKIQVAPLGWVAIASLGSILGIFTSAALLIRRRRQKKYNGTTQIADTV
ncbi:transglutaminase domain-containing protein [Candidatus Microgenomates bacterium]|nr:transglutaminase domain-containing protein [Candidatus Microgenomates bacterium]